MSVPAKLHLEARAKLNLGLAVLGKRSDGFHDLLSVFQTISLSDRLTVERAEGSISLSCTDPSIPEGPENLAWRAAEAVRAQFGVRAGMRVKLEKRIPSGAGLGGGSSDAASVVRAAVEVWGIDAPTSRLHEVCLELGSDVPYFLVGGAALVEGRGERITPLVVRDAMHVVVAMPPVHVATGWAYAQLERPFLAGEPFRALIEELRAGRLTLLEFCGHVENDFQRVVERHHPEVAAARRRLLELGASSALMTGSGSAVFGTFASGEDAARAAACCRSEVPAVAAHTVGAQEASG